MFLHSGFSRFTLTLLLGCTALSEAACAHGVAGNRFFPATLATDDPFVADELSLPTLYQRRTRDAEGLQILRTSVSVDFSKRLTTNLGVGLGTTYRWLRPDDGRVQNGFDNSSANLKYQFYQDGEHETILSVGIDWEIGGSGAKRINAESFGTITPRAFFGKGFGDLPDAIRYLRPLALTGSAGLAVPTRSSTTTFGMGGDPSTERHAKIVQLGFAVEYSLPYLQSFVRDVGWRAPFSHIIPLVEVSVQKPFGRDRGPTTGTINPGVVIPGKTMQFGIEAVIPINGRNGSRTGVLMQLHFFLDDLFPTSVGRPLFVN